MRLIEEKIHLINERISSDFKTISDVGALNGLGGLALFNFHYSKTFNIGNKIGHSILENCIEKINDGYDNPTYCNGIIGLGWVVNYLVKENLIDESNNEILPDIDKFAFYCLQESIKENNFDFLHGAIGYANYLIERLENSTHSSREIIGQLLFLLIEYFEILFRNIQLFAKDPEITIKMSFENKAIFGLAHGISSIIFILNKISQIPSFTTKSLFLANQYTNHLLKYYSPEKKGISSFPNYEDAAGVIKYCSALSWCSGDLGIGFNLLNTSIRYNHNDSYKKLGIQILKHAAQRQTLEDTLLQSTGICHGYFGAYKIFSNTYKLTSDKDFDSASKYWLNKGLENLQISTKPDLSILYGLSGIGLTLLEVFKSQDLNWDKSLFLH